MTEREKDLRERAAEAEKRREEVAAGKYRCRYHLMPPVGWMNDPNGLSKIRGRYHVFFQYAPESADGRGMHGWGLYTSPDLLVWTYEGMKIYPDAPFDEDGAYSGSVVPEGKGFRLYYTGNVKHKDKAYDYISDGRESNTVLIRSEDGIALGKKQVLLRTEDYPAEFTRHIRDPKVNRTEKRYEMFLGGRLKGDKGAVLRYQSADGENFSLEEILTTKKPFGYMWECPDFFRLDGREYLCVSPQGMPHERYRYQNRYASGYFEGAVSEDNFREWDFGFDFYAPQTFWDGTRRILYGWIGMPDAPYDNLPTVAEGWQGALTMPRVLTAGKRGLLQNPAPELESLRGRELSAEEESDSFELLLRSIAPGTRVELCGALSLSFGESEVVLRFFSPAGRGREVRRAATAAKCARIFLDVSVCEIYLNDGEAVLTTRLYPECYTLRIDGDCLCRRYEMLPLHYRE